MPDTPWPAPTQATRAREFISKRRQQLSGIALVITIVVILVVNEFIWNIPGI